MQWAFIVSATGEMLIRAAGNRVSDYISLHYYMHML